MGRVLLRARDAGGVQRRTVFFKPGTVSSVFSGGPAEAAGLVVGDVLLTVNGVPTSDWERLAKLDDQLRIHDEITYQVQHKNGRGRLCDCSSVPRLDRFRSKSAR